MILEVVKIAIAVILASIPSVICVMLMLDRLSAKVDKQLIGPAIEDVKIWTSKRDFWDHIDKLMRVSNYQKDAAISRAVTYFGGPNLAPDARTYALGRAAELFDAAKHESKTFRRTLVL